MNPFGIDPMQLCRDRGYTDVMIIDGEPIEMVNREGVELLAKFSPDPAKAAAFMAQFNAQFPKGEA